MFLNWTQNKEKDAVKRKVFLTSRGGSKLPKLDGTNNLTRRKERERESEGGRIMAKVVFKS